MNDKPPTWAVKDIPILKNTVLTEPNPWNGEIRQMTAIGERVREQVIQTKSDQIRNALIDMGWSPPDMEYPRVKLDLDFVGFYASVGADSIFAGHRVDALRRDELFAIIGYMSESLIRIRNSQPGGKNERQYGSTPAPESGNDAERGGDCG